MRLYKRVLLTLCLVFAGIYITVRNTNNIKSSRIWPKRPNVPFFDKHEDAENEKKLLTPTELAEHLPSTQTQAVQDSIKPVAPDTASPYPPGTPKVPGSAYTKSIILGQLSSENTTWLTFLPNITSYVYDTSPSANQPNSLLPLPRPKGHEAIVYLTHIITHYDTLTDVNIFIHAHRFAWHNNELLNHDAVEMASRLSAERVIREGYMNLRCHWKPGCPDGMRELATREEEAALVSAWPQLFPGEELPAVLASPCCAQFALSRDRIRRLPLERYVALQRWLLDTQLDNHVSGRVFEYVWHRIFTGLNVVCPDMQVCYCDGYGVCFDDGKTFDHWFELRFQQREAERKLEEWKETVRVFEEVRKEVGAEEKGLAVLETMNLKVPAADGDVELEKEIERLKGKLENMRLWALWKGTDPEVRAKVAGRVWKVGDGY